MTVDYQKCFDSLEHDAIWGSLRYFNFGERLIEWIQLLFRDFELCTQNNGHLSQFFYSSRSIHQGCPAAAFLFILTAQVLHDLIVNNKNIKGVNIYDMEMLISQFADDTTLYLQFDEKTLNEVVNTLAILYNNTGLSVNYNKTNIYRVGSLRDSQAQLYTTCVFNWTNQPIQTLGITIPLDLNIDQLCNLNY